MYFVLGWEVITTRRNYSRLFKTFQTDKTNYRKTKKVREVIIAISQDIEGQATSIYLANLLNKYDIKITTLARGIPSRR